MQRLRVLFLTVVILSPFLLDAAIAPKSPEQLDRAAVIIATGTVESAEVSVSGNPAQSRWNLNLMVRVEAIEKGEGTDGIEPGDAIEVFLWSSRTMSLPGHQGMDVVPSVGGQAKFWLRKNKERILEPVYPNGIEMLAGHPQYDFMTFERQRGKRMAFWIGIPVLVIAAIGISLLVKSKKNGDLRSDKP